MADHIPFVNTQTDCALVTEFYSDSRLLRLSLGKVRKLRALLPGKSKLWIDAAVDGLGVPLADSLSLNKGWHDHMSRFPGSSRIGERAFQQRPDPVVVAAFVEAILNECLAHEPAAISIPQVPMKADVSRNKLNRALAAATGEWREGSGYSGRLVLPVIFTNQSQLNGKTARNAKLNVVESCCRKGRADEIWAVDSSLRDQAGSRTFLDKRFPGLIALHEEIRQALPDKPVIAGPYWGMNLLLWSKGLCDNPAIGVGGAYQYHISGGRPSRPNIRLALPPLRRWAVAGPEFKKWLTAAMESMDENDDAYADFDRLRRNYTGLATRDGSRPQIARFYKEWCDDIETVHPAGRALAMYQMLSSAYVLGKTLPPLPAEEKTASPPERVAEYMMLSCL